MKTLYVSDLDGTLLRSDETISDYMNSTINELVNKGMIFSYATARSYYTAHKVVVFDDEKNDVDMFMLADEAYAVENAVKELKELATAVIDSNNNDGVARWLKNNFYI